MTKANPRTKYKGEKVRLHLALELSAEKWLLAFAPSLRDKPYRRTITAGDRATFESALAAAKTRFGLGAETSVVSCYEAGRDAFWVHRWLQSQGVENQVIDSSSIEVPRRARRPKTDGLDVGQLLRLVIRYHLGEERVYSALRIPPPEAEDARHMHRSLKGLKGAQNRATNRIRGLLATQGIRLQKIGPGLEQRLVELRDWEGQPLRPGLRQRLAEACRHWEYVREQIGRIESQRRQLLRSSRQENLRGVRHLMQLKAVGLQSSWILEHELFAWRQIESGKSVGALAGMVPTPFKSGELSREQGISKSGNRWVRSVAVELAWMWLRYQPQSALTQWFQRRFAHGGVRARKVGIVALTRRLLIQLWRYRQYGVVPPGAVLKTDLRF
jgi:transposase